MKLVKIILSQMLKISKPQRKFLTKAIEAFLSVSGKLTFSNMSRYIDLSERTFARQFSKTFNFADFNRRAIDLFYGSKECSLAIAFDPFFMSKSGDKTYGHGSFWSGGSGRVEKGIEASLLCAIDLIKRVAYPLSAKQTPNSEELKKACETGTEMTRIDWFSDYIISMIPMFPVGVKYLLVDAYFFKEKFITNLRNSGMHVISKMRKDAKLLALYSGPQKSRGRRKKFDGIVNFDQLNGIATDDPNITLQSVIAYSVALKRNILVVKLSKLRSNGKTMSALLFSTDTSMRPLDVLNYYSVRFQIEFVIRDAKQHAGLTHCQSWIKERIDFHINISFVAVNIARIKEYQRLENDSTNTACSVATQRVRFHNEMLIRSIFPMFGLDILTFKSHPAYEQALSFGAIRI